MSRQPSTHCSPSFTVFLIFISNTASSSDKRHYVSGSLLFSIISLFSVFHNYGIVVETPCSKLSRFVSFIVNIFVLCSFACFLIFRPGLKYELPDRWLQINLRLYELSCLHGYRPENILLHLRTLLCIDLPRCWQI